MKCLNCKEKIEFDMEGDLIHSHLNNKGVDPRKCDPTCHDSKYALRKCNKIED